MSKKIGYSEPVNDYDIELPAPVSFSPDLRWDEQFTQGCRNFYDASNGFNLSNWTTNFN